MPEELSQEDIDALLSGAMTDGGDEGGDDIGALLGSAEPMALPELGGEEASDVESGSIDMLYDVELGVKIELGRCYMSIDEILKMREGSVIQLDKDAGAPVDILINGQLVALGEVLVLNDYFCVRITEILSDRARAIIKR